MICSSVCRFRVIAPSCGAHLSTGELPSQWSTLVFGEKVIMNDAADQAIVRYLFRFSTESFSIHVSSLSLSLSEPPDLQQLLEKQ